MSSNVHQIAQNGFGTGTNALYDRARPSYPSDALSAIRATLKKSPPYNIAEIGAGTGIFTRAFLSHPEWASDVKEFRAVEPSAGMRDQFSSKLSDPRVSIAEGTFDDTHIPDGWADLIVVAQAFHWCPDYEKAVIEFNRILTNDGRAVLIWNLEDAATPWVAQLRNLYEAYEQGTPQFRLGLWRQTFETPSYTKLFQPQQELLFSHTITGSLPGTIDRAFTKSYIAVTSDETKEMLKKEITEIISRGDGKVWIDQEQGTFKYPYNTTVIIMQKKN